MKVALYSRVSTDNQEIDKQKNRLREWAESKGHEFDEYSEVVSSVAERPEFEDLMQNVSDYDALVVTDLDRFGRSTRDILEKIDELTEKGVAFKCIDQPMLNTDPSEEASPLQEAMRELMSVFASFERKTIRKRMEREYRKAVDDGKVGRPKVLNKDEEDYVWNKHERGYSFNTIKALVNEKYDKDISKAPVQRVINERRDLD